MADCKQQLKVKICPICKKEYIFRDGWVYRKKSGEHEKVFCSWGCMRKWEKAHSHTPERREKIKQALRDGLTVNETAELLDEDRSLVLYWAKKIGVTL